MRRFGIRFPERRNNDWCNETNLHLHFTKRLEDLEGI